MHFIENLHFVDFPVFITTFHTSGAPGVVLAHIQETLVNKANGAMCSIEVLARFTIKDMKVTGAHFFTPAVMWATAFAHLA